MKLKNLRRLGIDSRELARLAKAVTREAGIAGQPRNVVKQRLTELMGNPAAFFNDRVYGRLARAVAGGEADETEAPLKTDVGYRTWGHDIDEAAHRQMENACKLPVTVAAALMPDAHVGYGLPIGGVLATENAVIPYAVGVDIACRVMVTVFDLPPEKLAEDEDRFQRAIEKNTVFGVGGKWKKRKQHPVMDEDWSVSPVTARLKDLAADQLGTSGSGNHFVEFGEFELFHPVRGAPAGRYLAVVSHSGSRGPGANVCQYYSQLARSLHRNLPQELRYLAWLPMNAEGAEYWAAMELMGKFASANHHVIHEGIIATLGEQALMQVENHHNYAWKERHAGREVIVHRKGATPAGRGVLGYIPGTMAAPGYLVEGLGDKASLDSASHGAGRAMSRQAAKSKYRWSDVKDVLDRRGVHLISAGLDEAPMAYKDIDAVMAAQADLVRPVGRFFPRLVKMAPAGERPED